MIQFDSYFSDGLKPPTSNIMYVVVYVRNTLPFAAMGHLTVGLFVSSSLFIRLEVVFPVRFTRVEKEQIQVKTRGDTTVVQ